MLYFIATEFIDTGRVIDLISIGIVSDDGREYYAESAEFDITLASPWTVNNVLPYLCRKKKLRIEIAEQVEKFVGNGPIFWGYYCEYDWVAMCQLYGKLINIPSSWPTHCNDLQQVCSALGNPPLPIQLHKHHALQNARWHKRVHAHILGK